MAITTDILTKLIYIDSDFISSIYEEVKKVSPKTQFSKTQGIKADGSIKIFSAGVQSQETKSFTLSSFEMLKDIYDELENYPQFKPKDFKNYKGTQTVWFNGEFTMGEWVGTKNEATSEAEIQTHIMYEIKGKDYDYALLAQPQLFSSNIGSLIEASPAIRRYIGIPIKAFGRVLYYLEDANRFVVTPYLIIETEK
jgi:hypothetical protein